MTVRLITAALAITLITACSQGQKGRVQLTNEMDSVSYAIGADIGANFKRSKLDSVNIDAIAMGLRDGLDSVVMMDEATQRQCIEGFMAKARVAAQAEERAAGEANRAKGETFLAENAKRKGVVTTASGLQYEVLKQGKGPKPTAKDTVNVTYTGMFIDGEEFDGSGPVPKDMWLGQVMPGWVEAIQLMPVGSKFKFFIPSSLMYGETGTPGGPIPPNSALLFDVELFNIKK